MASTSGYYTDNFGWVSISERLKQQVAGLNLQNIQDVNNKSASDNVSPLSDKGSIWVGGGGNAVDVIDPDVGDNESFLIADTTDPTGWRLSNDPDNLLTNTLTAKTTGNINIEADEVVLTDISGTDEYLRANEDVINLKKQVNVGSSTSVYTTPTMMYFGNQNQNRKIVLGQSADNDHQYYGFGRQNNELRCQLLGQPAVFRIFTGDNGGTSSTLRHELRGDGSYNAHGAIFVIGASNPDNPKIDFGSTNVSTIGKVTTPALYFSNSVTDDLCINSANNLLLGTGTNAASINVLSNRVIQTRAQINVGTSAAGDTTQFIVATKMYFGDNDQNRKIVLGGTADNNHQFIGFGKQSNELRVQLNSTSANMNIFAATGTGASQICCTIGGDRNLNVFGPTLIVGGADPTSPKLQIGGSNPSEIGKASSAGNWFTGSAVNELCLRSPVGVLLGVTGQPAIRVNTTGIVFPRGTGSHNATLALYKDLISTFSCNAFGQDIGMVELHLSRVNGVCTVSWEVLASTGSGTTATIGGFPTEFRPVGELRFPVWMRRNNTILNMGWLIINNSANIVFTTAEPYITGTTTIFSSSVSYHIATDA